MYLIDALKSFGIDIEVQYVWENIVKCNLHLEVDFASDCDGWELGAINLPGICLSRTALLQLATQIAHWKAVPGSEPKSFHGSFDLTVIEAARIELTFISYLDVVEKTRGEFSFKLWNANFKHFFRVDESALATLSIQLTRLLDR